MKVMQIDSWRTIRTAALALVVACLVSLSGWLALPSYAANQPTAPEAQVEEREQAYEQAKAIAEDPKMGVEKEYEKEVEAYEQEHSGGNLLEKAKELVTETTGK